jgi:peptidoglycan-associated lipoprotein
MRTLDPRSIRAILAATVIGATLITGCAKKPAVTPAPPPAPPAVEAPTQPPPPPAPPQESAPAPAALKSEDFQPAFFDYDSYGLRADAMTALDQNAKLLRANAAARITIEGHCDERGTVEYNQALGERRAQAARDYLVAAGIDASRISVISYGKERPFATGQDEASWQQNRRAHFVLRGAS